MAAKGTETRYRGLRYLYCEIWVRGSNFSSQGKDVDRVVLLIALAPPESNVYFMKPAKGKVEAKLFFTRKLQKEFSFAQTILLLHAFWVATLNQMFIEKAKHYSYIVQKSTKPDKNIADIF
ncbi:hypothetical protein AVEN_52597-1 [Araneus ventricosus]|uniref:Uncharacterized protein n=1 Tax=Araneus ventricosus TaxID=182803 RepID=A0A4Y2ENG4_ARAVE|nr:hypothetical protein AVEN_52597-1 [Araneus ventricosus]